MIDYVDEKHVLYYLFFIFTLIFFLSPNLRLHCNLFYAIIIPVYLVSFQKNRFRGLWESKIWLTAVILIVYLLVTMLWEKNTGSKGHEQGGRHEREEA